MVDAEPAPDPDAPLPAQCGMDVVRETVCGVAEPGGKQVPCGPRGDSLTGYGPMRTVDPGYTYTDDPVLGGFRLDDEATRAYRAGTHIPAERLEGHCCYSRCTPLRVAPSATFTLPEGMIEGEHCLPAPQGGTRHPNANEPHCPAAVGIRGAMRPLVRTHAEAMCCYAVAFSPPQEPQHQRGRAARIDGAARVAGVLPDETWPGGSARPRVGALDAPTRARLAMRWREDARMEHASIAAFARTSLELAAFGAPPDLLAEVHAAALDEISHARDAFALASAYAGHDVGPAPFTEVQRMTLAPDLASLARETLEDGCIGETVAAVEAALAAHGATDEVVRECLARIAEDEARHAELAFRILAFAARRGGEAVAEVLRAALDGLDARAQVPCAEEACADASLAVHGIVCAHARARIHAEVLAGVVRPCLQSLLETS
jgi:hypothetical protein